MLDLATVVYHQELEYLKIQARSIELYVDPKLINNIWIIVNDNTPCDIDPAWYGINANKVKIIGCNELAIVTSVKKEGWPDHTREGWRTQQLYKLLISTKITSDWYAVLDAKTWFVQPINQNTIFLEDRVCSGVARIPHWFTNSIEEVKKIYDVDIDSMLGPGGVPFVFHTTTTQEMLKETTNIVGRSFVDYFLEKSNFPCWLTEFILYSSYVLKKYKSWDFLYITNIATKLQGFNIAAEEDLSSFSMLQRFNILSNMRPQPIVVSMHKNAWNKIDSEYQEKWLAYLKTKKLIDYTTDTDSIP